MMLLLLGYKPDKIPSVLLLLDVLLVNWLEGVEREEEKGKYEEEVSGGYISHG